jgi:integrase
MPKYHRVKTNYPGVYYIEGRALDGRPEKIFYISYYRQGKRIEEKAGRQHRDKMTAARANQVRTGRIEGRAPSNQARRELDRAQTWTLNALWAAYSEPLVKKGKNYVTDYGRYKNYLQPALGEKEPKDLAPTDVHRLRLGLGKRLQPQSVKHVLALLQRLINFGSKQGLCAAPSFKIELPRVHNQKTEFLTTEQLQALTEALEFYDWEPLATNFVRLALFTGLRRGELFKLRWDDIDFERGFLTLRAPKGGRDQTVPLSPAAQAVLARHPRQGKSPFIFPGRGGGQRTRPPKLIQAIKERAGLPRDFRPLHGLRHSFASLLASSGRVDLYTLQKLLTHKSPQMTQRYAHLRDESLRRAADLAGELIGQAVNGKENNLIFLPEEK